MITRGNLIQTYLEFFKAKNHNVIPNSSLIPLNDSTTLFISAGMQPLVPYLLGKRHPLGKRLANVQKCVRTTDIEEVGDETHHTFFEMLGNWSLGDYWKKEAIKMSYEFLTSKKWFGLDKNRIAVSVFSGDKNAPGDIESKKIWRNLKIPEERSINLREDNWWGPAGKTGPCGPDTEMFYWNSKEKIPKEFNPENKKWVEIWNDVFMQYIKGEKGNYTEAKQKNVDTGMGVERTLAVLNKLDDNYLTEVFLPITKKIEKLSGKKYKGNEKSMRIIADHIKASVFIISDGVLPSNTEQGYVLRRLIRRAVVHGKKLGLKDFTGKVAESVFPIYGDYKELTKNKKKILKILQDEENKFEKTLEKGFKILKKESNSLNITRDLFSGKTAFLLYQSYGFPVEITKEILRSEGVDLDEKGFNKELLKHQKLSRTASAGKFKSGLSDSSKETTKLHTATHLLNEALRRVLNKNIRQKGSNITQERLRFDFNFPRKLSEEEIKKVEDLVNKKISEELEVIREEMPLKKALKTGASSEFGARYPGMVSIYTIPDPKDEKEWFSKEICTGPHVKNTKEIGKFKIVKEESSASGVRRIKAEVLDEKN